MTLSTKSDGATFYATEYNEIARRCNTSLYSAYVFQDGTNTVAIDKYGTQLSSVTIASKTDHTPINAALTYCNGLGGGVAVIGAGTYQTAGLINIPFNCEIKCVNTNNVKFLLNAATLTTDFCRLTSKSVWDGGYIVDTGSTNWTNSVFTMKGSDMITPDGDSTAALNQGIRNVLIQKTIGSVGGSAIYFDCESGSGSSQIFLTLNENITIKGPFQYGIRLSCGNRANTFIIWNVFRNVFMWHPKIGIYMNRPYTGAYGSYVSENSFYGFWYQGSEGTLGASVGMDINGGHDNSFYDFHFADFVAGDTEYNFDSYTLQNYMALCTNAIGTLVNPVDSGSNNKIIPMWQS